jgi:hypothetical protein
VLERVELTGWEQIAAHLKVSVRTAQVYEREQGLPVYRLPGPKGRVWAVARELESWKLNSASESPEHKEFPNITPVVLETPLTMPEVVIKRRQVLLPILAGSGALLAGVGYAFARLGMLEKRPVDWRVAGNTLTVLGDNGRALWHHRFPAQMEPGSYRRIPGLNCCVFTDLDGDGRWETVFIYRPINPGADGQKLVCFNANGNIRWEFFTSHKVIDREAHEWTPPYSPANFVIISPRSGPGRVVLTSVHYWSFPSQVVVLDAAGKLVGEFWHRGHLRHLGVADLDGDGVPHVLVGGVNDAPEYKQATLLAFDPAAVSGASCSPTGQPYFHGFSPGTQRAEIFFPRTPVSRDQEFNRVI